MLIAMTATVILVSSTILVHYEALRLISLALPHLTLVRPRARVVAVIFAVFAAHTVEVYLYAIGYWVLMHGLHFGFGEMPLVAAGGTLTGQIGISGGRAQDFFDLVYFSLITYSSIGFGDVVPLGPLRLVAGVEGLNGLLLIAWSASFTYLYMERTWPLHGRRR